ncbi:MAG TPA: hypothetical protein PKW39_06500, partial [Rectinema sp.]|nr:hypothetical protein [Rectinema sp.]
DLLNTLTGFAGLCGIDRILFLFFFPQTQNPVHPSLILSSRPSLSPNKKSSQSSLHPAILSKHSPVHAL